MQKQIIPNHLEWQSAPSKNLVFDFPETSRQENNKHNTRTNDPVSIIERIFRDEISRHIYPDFRYSCRYCGTLDIFIKVSKSIGIIEINCLDCKRVEIFNVNGVNASSLC